MHITEILLRVDRERLFDDKCGKSCRYTIIYQGWYSSKIIKTKYTLENIVHVIIEIKLRKEIRLLS